MGFGVAIALLIDATIVRLVVIPAAMQLLGERNWYLPSWLEWLPHVEIEDPALSAAASAASAERRASTRRAQTLTVAVRSLARML